MAILCERVVAGFYLILVRIELWRLRGKADKAPLTEIRDHVKAHNLGNWGEYYVIAIESTMIVELKDNVLHNAKSLLRQ
jgi:hypothetical protein